MNDPIERRPHAALDVESRQRKARKIEVLLGLDHTNGPMRLLEVGAGSGGISHYFATHPSGRYDVDAVDVVDSRTVTAGYRYLVVLDTTLPFEDGSFDVVISNHVIEHVGDAGAQQHHLEELHRVLRRDGIGYLAVPNRWMLVEPHFKIAFLSWWPERWRTRWLRLFRRGHVYDCRPFERRPLEKALGKAGFAFEQLHGSALKATYDIESPHSPIYRLVLRHLPDTLFRYVRSVFPTLIYRTKRQQP